MEKITAVVVTYNRLACLKRVIESLRKQSIALYEIIVVNNGSTDGTTEWLELQKDLIVFHQENVGGSGGFYRGIQEALKRKNDWIWCMDDDVYPREKCLVNLLEAAKPGIGILCPQRIQNGKIFVAEVKRLNLSNPFLRLHNSLLTEKEAKGDFPVNISGMVFEGPLIKRDVVEDIGLPTQGLFILYDDTDYSYRAVVAGYKVLYVPSAILDKEYFFQNSTREEMVNKNRWKTWYQIRNHAYFCKHHGKTYAYRLFGGIGLPIHIFIAILANLSFNKKYVPNDLLQVWRMYRKGRKGELGKI